MCLHLSFKACTFLVLSAPILWYSVVICVVAAKHSNAMQGPVVDRTAVPVGAASSTHGIFSRTVIHPFLIHINDLLLFINFSDKLIFADDVTQI